MKVKVNALAESIGEGIDGVIEYWKASGFLKKGDTQRGRDILRNITYMAKIRFTEDIARVAFDDEMFDSMR